MLEPFQSLSCLFIAFQDAFYFSDVKQGVQINRFTNFWNFHNALITLFRTSTGEDWFQIMYDLKKSENFKFVAQPFFLSYVMLNSFVMLNLFILIIVNDFEEFNLKDNNHVEEFKANLENFKIIWTQYSKEFNGTKISYKMILPFFRSLNPPLGFGQKADRLEITKALMRMNFQGDFEGNVYFQELLFCCLRRVYGENIAQKTNSRIVAYLSIEEQNTKTQIKKEQNKILVKQLGKEKFTQLKLKHQSSRKSSTFIGKNNNSSKNDNTNSLNSNEIKMSALYLSIFVRMAFLCWENYAKKQEKRKQKIDQSKIKNNNKLNAKEISSNSSSSSSDELGDSDQDIRELAQNLRKINKEITENDEEEEDEKNNDNIYNFQTIQKQNLSKEENDENFNQKQATIIENDKQLQMIINEQIGPSKNANSN